MSEFQRRYLPTNAVLRSFESAARHQSFTQAAEELHLTQSAISRQVKELEGIVGTELFRRVGRGVVLSNAGKVLAAELAVDLANIRRTIMRAVSAGKMGSAIRVASLPAFASRFLIPKLPKFFDQHPNIEISISTRLKPFDMSEGHFDLAIHFGKPDWPGTEMTYLCNENLIPVASPQFIDKHSVTKLHDYARVPLLHLNTRPFAWLEYLESIDSVVPSSMAGKYFDEFTMIIAAATVSMGAGLIPSYLIEAEIDSGKLVALSQDGMQTSNSYFMVTPKGKPNQSAQALSDWMKTCVTSSDATHSVWK